MDNNLNIRINTTANTSGIDKTNQSLDALGGSSSKNISFVERLNGAFAPLAAITAAAGVGLQKLTAFMGSTVTEASGLQSSLTGLNSIARAFKQDAGAAERAAQDLAKDGLMTVAESAAGLKNLLAAGFNLPQAIQLMSRFKDTAAFGRQGSLSFGEAIRGATEGIKNGNSILVDNAGVTKNLSVILSEAGFSAQDLMKATTDVNIRQALFNGLMKESAPMLGDASRLTELYAGKQAQASAQMKILKQNLGQALQTAILPFLKAITPIITSIANWIQNNQKLAAAIGIAIGVFLALITIVGIIGTAIAALTPIIAAFGLLTIGWVLLIVAAFAAAVAAIIVFWEPIKNFFVGLWHGIQNVISSFIGWLRQNWPLVLGILTGPIGFAVGWVIQHWSQVTAFFSRIPGVIANAFSGLYHIMTSPFTRAWDFISQIPGRIVNSIGNIGQLLREKIGNWDIPGPLGKVKDVIPGFATGVRNFGGGLAVVGERGPELVNLPRGADVFTNGESRKMLSGGAGSSTEVHYHAPIYLTTPEATREFFTMQGNDNELVRRGLTPRHALGVL